MTSLCLTTFEGEGHLILTHALCAQFQIFERTVSRSDHIANDATKVTDTCFTDGVYIPDASVGL